MTNSIELGTLRVGDSLPDLEVKVTEKMIIMGATGSRDWQPIHHNRGWARDKANLPDIIMNNYTQAGWLCRYVTDWGGPKSRIGKIKFKMRQPICPGDVLRFAAQISAINEDADPNNSFYWVALTVAINVGEQTVTSGEVMLALSRNAESDSPWRCPLARWQP